MNTRIALFAIGLIAATAVVRAERIAVIPKGTTHEFWKSVHAGAMKAGRELGVEILWKGPQREDDRELQIKVVEDFITQKVDGIVLAPLDDRALMRPVREARRAGIPTVVFDSDLQGAEHVSFVATDNRAGGALAGEHMMKLLGGKGKIVVLRYIEGSASNSNREDGFLHEVRKHPGVEVISENQFAGATIETAYRAAQNLLNRFDQIDGIFCPNQPVTFGMLRALRDSGRAGSIRFIGFDAGERLVEGIASGDIDALVVQDPVNIGEMGVRTIVAHLRKERVDPIIRTRLALVTPMNLETPEIRELLFPDLGNIGE